MRPRDSANCPLPACSASASLSRQELRNSASAYLCTPGRTLLDCHRHSIATLRGTYGFSFTPPARRQREEECFHEMLGIAQAHTARVVALPARTHRPEMGKATLPVALVPCGACHLQASLAVDAFPIYLANPCAARLGHLIAVRLCYNGCL